MQGDRNGNRGETVQGTLQHFLLDLITRHYYPQQSRRIPFASRRAHPSRLLNPAHLDEAAHWADRLACWRDRFAPGTPIWLGETGNAQFGGEPGLSDVCLASADMEIRIRPLWCTFIRFQPG